MASISKNSKGFKRICFTDAKGHRRAIYLGRMANKQAESILTQVEVLVTAAAAQVSPPLETAMWLGKIGEELHRKLSNVGLTDERQSDGKPARHTLKQFLDAYIASRHDVKKSTQTFYGHTRRCLIEYFGPTKKLGAITFADASKWRRWLSDEEELAESTVRRRCTMARQFFADAVDDRLIGDNPFRKLKGIGVKANRSRDYFISRQDAEKVIDACPDAEWRLIFALSRYGGLRCPSEHVALRWGDVNLETGRMTVHSPKTEHHEGKDYRVIPIFPELRAYLEDARELAGELADDSTAPVITRYNDPKCNLRSQLVRIIKRAGLKPWPKLFQNLRATRETELAEEFPIQAACAWIGNSKKVALSHYLQVTDAHFEAALATTRQTTQSAAEPAGIEKTGAETTRANPEKPPVLGHLEEVEVGGTRLELVTSTV